MGSEKEEWKVNWEKWNSLERVVTLKECVSVLDKALGDTDPCIDEEITEDEIKEEYPMFWVCQNLSLLIQELEAQQNNQKSEG